jgi:hypothetical protein
LEELESKTLPVDTYFPLKRPLDSAQSKRKEELGWKDLRLKRRFWISSPQWEAFGFISTKGGLRGGRRKALKFNI